MNPHSSTMSAAPPVAPATPAPAPATPVEQPTTSSSPSVVTNIPVHTQQAAPAPVGEDVELDKIMHDVGQELKKEDKKPEKHGLLGFLHHEPKPLVKVNNQPAKQAASSMAPAPAPLPVPVQAAPSIAQTAIASQAQPQAAMAPAKPKTQRHAPVFVIFIALCVTGFLVAAAIAAYRQT